jgi:hypothetical protein
LGVRPPVLQLNIHAGPELLRVKPVKINADFSADAPGVFQGKMLL